MAVKTILIHPDPRLKTVCDPIVEFNRDTGALAEDMLETMYDAVGIGLAGPQIGVMKNIFVMDCSERDETTEKPIVMINPKITWESEERSGYEEGCLSIPNQFEMVERPSDVRIAWQDVTGAEHEREFDGIWATCAQHEMDHLKGILFIDYLKPLKRQMITRKMQKLKRERARS